jgi:hypothetical protein
MKFSNPRLRAEFNDWPSGSHRVKCVFELEHKAKKGWKFYRTTQNPKTGLPNKPKGDIAYAREGAIVDGDDGRTYLIQRAGNYNFITVHSSDFKSAYFDTIQGGVFPESSPELFAELNAMIDEANKTVDVGANNAG